LITEDRRVLFPSKCFGLGVAINRFLAWLPGVRNLCLRQYTIARLAPLPSEPHKQYSISIVIPCKNEKGNVEPAIKRIPDFPTPTEIIFVEGGSTDGTLEEILRV
jgi:hypothetical protein